VLDRFGQIEPVVLFAAEGYYYNGKGFDCLEKIEEILQDMPTVKRCVIVSYTRGTKGRTLPVKSIGWEEFVEPHPAGDIAFNRVPFNHPAYVMFSSGTTGAPKCIVHGVGGTVLQHLKELRLHSDVRDGDRVVLLHDLRLDDVELVVSCLGCSATLLQYDGSPFHHRRATCCSTTPTPRT